MPKIALLSIAKKPENVANCSMSRMQGGPNSGSLQDDTSEGLHALETGVPTNSADADRMAPTN